MADINFATSGKRPDPARPVEGEVAHQDLIEALFFAYRDFVGDPDEILAKIGFGRAHHRVLYFVCRNPGLPVAELLDILKITKQSLARVLRDLIEADYIEQKTGPTDRRQRLLYATETGRALAAELSAPQSRRIARALSGLSPEAAADARAFLKAMTNPPGRPTPPGKR
jgi:DNA-binding MarR family transcriptional regulator